MVVVVVAAEVAVVEEEEEEEAFLLAMSFRNACIWRTTSNVSGSTAISFPCVGQLRGNFVRYRAVVLVRRRG